ncbi:unnamed protein product [Gadus morhua 'NCC']
MATGVTAAGEEEEVRHVSNGSSLSPAQRVPRTHGHGLGRPEIQLQLCIGQHLALQMVRLRVASGQLYHSQWSTKVGPE